MPIREDFESVKENLFTSVFTMKYPNCIQYLMTYGMTGHVVSGKICLSEAPVPTTMWRPIISRHQRCYSDKTKTAYSITKIR